jgi:hypothetical protein
VSGAQRIRVGRWEIKAELRPSQPASLVISGDDGKTVLTAGESSSSLVEEAGGVDVRCVDELPAAVR